MKRDTQSTIKLILIAIMLLVGKGALHCFRPEYRHFYSDYQFAMYLSWLERGDFATEGPASISQHSISMTFLRRSPGEQVPVEFDLRDGKIVTQIERITDIITADDRNLENRYRYYLEQLLFRLNTTEEHFVKDFVSHFKIELRLDGFDSIKTLVTALQTAGDGERLQLSRCEFFEKPDQTNGYRVLLNNTYELEVIFDAGVDLTGYAHRYRSKEADLAKLHRIDPPRKIERDETPYLPAAVEPVPKPLKISTDMRVTDFIKSYKDINWGRNMIHNKIEDSEAFIRSQFPGHQLQNKGGEIKLVTDKFQELFSGNIKLVERILRDGVLFNSSPDYSIDDNRNVTLATGEVLSFAALNDQEISIVAPYMNQLLTMHRVMGTELLNFLLIPAPVPTTLVIRDPERKVMMLDSYTDLILMLSYYWQERKIYFNIDSVKKVNNFVEMSGSLVAYEKDEESFDFAEVLFALDENHRIDLAMFILHTEVDLE